MDPGREAYKNEMVEQTRRRVASIPHFQGLVVDRSDYVRERSGFLLLSFPAIASVFPPYNRTLTDPIWLA